jgi:hypothetical protein
MAPWLSACTRLQRQVETVVALLARAAERERAGAGASRGKASARRAAVAGSESAILGLWAEHFIGPLRYQALRHAEELSSRPKGQRHEARSLGGRGRYPATAVSWCYEHVCGIGSASSCRVCMAGSARAPLQANTCQLVGAEAGPERWIRRRAALSPSAPARRPMRACRAHCTRRSLPWVAALCQRACAP